MDHERLWLWSEDCAVKVALPIDAVQAYLPSLATRMDFLEATASSNLSILLDGVSGELLSTIHQYLRHHFPRAAATDAEDDKEAQRKWIDDFVQCLDTEMMELMRAEVAKRNSTAQEMVLLHNSLEKAANERISHWKHALAKKYIPNMQ